MRAVLIGAPHLFACRIYMRAVFIGAMYLFIGAGCRAQVVPSDDSSADASRLCSRTARRRYVRAAVKLGAYVVMGYVGMAHVGMTPHSYDPYSHGHIVGARIAMAHTVTALYRYDLPPRYVRRLHVALSQPLIQRRRSDPPSGACGCSIIARSFFPYLTVMTSHSFDRNMRSICWKPRSATILSRLCRL